MLKKDLINGYKILDGAKHFVEDESQNFLEFQSVFKCFVKFTGTDNIFAWKSKQFSEESSKTLVKSGNSFASNWLLFIMEE